MFDWLRKAAGAVGNAVNQGASFVARPYQQTFNQVSRGADDARRRLLEQQRAAAQAAQQARQQAQQQAQVNAQRLQQAVPKLNMGAAMSALGKVGMAANPANQFKNQSEIFNKRIAQPLNQLGQNQVMKQYGINQQQWNDLQKKSILDRAKFGIGNTVNSIKNNPGTAIARSPFSPAMGTGLLYPVLNSGPVSLPKVDISRAAQKAGESIARSRVGKFAPIGLAGEYIVKPTVSQVARNLDVVQGQKSYDKGLKGASQLGADAFTMGSLLYTPAKAGVTVAAIKQGGLKAGAKFIPGAVARGFGSGVGVNALNQAGEKGIRNIDPREALTAGAITGVANAALPFAPGLLKAALGRGNHVAPKIDFNAPQVAKNLADKGRLLSEGYTNVKVAKIGNVAQATPSPTVNQNVAKQALIHPEDQRVMNDLVAMNNGSYRPDAKTAQELELASSRIMEHYNLVHPDGVPVKDINGLAQTFQNVLESTDVPGRKAIKVPQFNQDAPKAKQYLYHGTDNINLDSITKEGLRPGRRGMLSLSKDEAYSKTFAKTPDFYKVQKDGVMFRVDADYLKGKTRPGKGPVSDQLNELLTKETIPPKYLEIQKNGQWQPLASNKPINELAPKSKVDPLLVEAKKYKSADEFVKAQGEPVYHGTSANRENLINKEGFGANSFFSTDKGNAKIYADVFDKDARVIGANVKLNKPIKVDVGGDYYTNLSHTGEIYYPDGTSHTIADLFGTDNLKGLTTEDVVAKLKASGEGDGVIFKNILDPKKDNVIVAFDKSTITTHKQLTDLYNQAHSGRAIAETAPEPKLPKGWKVNKEGEVLTPQGKVATPHDIENMEAGRVLSKKDITQFDQKQADLNTHGRTGAPIYETAPAPNVPTKTRGFVKTVKASEEVSDDVKKSVSGTYTPKQNSELVANADKFVKSKNAEKVLHDQLAVKAGNIDDQTIANAVTFAKKQDTLGNHDAASNIYDQLSEHLTQKGREIQAASLLSRRTPEGLQFSAQRLLKKSGVEMTPLIKKEIQANVTAIKATKLGTEQRDLAIAKMKSDLMKHIPQGTLDNLTSTWKAGLLSGVKTQGGNALSNSTFGIMKLTSNPVSAVADKAMSLFTGKRKFALTDRGLASGGLEGAKKGAYTLKTGIDARRISGVSDKYEQFSEINFKNKWVNKLVGTPSNLVFRGMSAADQPYYYAALKNSLYDQALAEGKNQGIKGVALRKFMKDKVQNADNSMVQTAVHDAEKAILGFDTVMSRIVSYAHKSIETAPISEAGKQSANATINAIAPFTKVPSAFLSRTVDYTPFGPIKTIIGQVSKKQFDQRALSQAIGEGVTGTGLIVLGSQLARADLLSGDYPKTDQKEQARWKAEGITQNSVKIGPNWVSLNYLGPLGLLFGAGKSFVDAEKKGASAMDTASSVVAGFGSGLLQQSFLQGLSGFINALNEPGRFMNNYVKQFAGSVVPSWINDIGNLTDKYKRQSTSIPEATMARIPGLRTNLKEQTDVFGNKLEQGGVNTINPFKPSPDTSNTLTNELDRLAGVSKDYNVWPTPPNNSDFFGKDTNVDYNQIKQIQADLGAQIQTAWQETMASQDYMSKDDRGKVELLTKVKRDITDTFKQQNASKYGQTITPKIAKVAKPKTARKSRRVASKRGRTGTSRGRVASIAKSKQPKFKSVRIARGTAPKISKTPRLKLRSYT